MDFEGFIKEIEAHNWNVHGVELYENGELSHEYGETREERFPIYSAAKTITLLAVGMAVDDGKLDIDSSVLSYLPSAVTANMPKIQQELFRHITIKRLLTMSVPGFPFRPVGESWLKNALRYPVRDENTFDYSNVSAYLAGVAASCALDEDLYEFLQRRLFKPLGITDPPCQRCPDGYFYGATGMSLTVHELSKIGMVLYNQGTYNGTRIVSERYIKDAVSVQQKNKEDGYGYFIWKYRDGFNISGKWGQKCYVLPSKKLMITFMAHMEDNSNELTVCMERYLIK